MGLADSPIRRQSRRELPLKIASVLKPKLKICDGNGVSLGEIPKTTLQEVLNTRYFAGMIF
jgi:hypothetical protein